MLDGLEVSLAFLELLLEFYFLHLKFGVLFFQGRFGFPYNLDRLCQPEPLLLAFTNLLDDLVEPYLGGRPYLNCWLDVDVCRVKSREEL